MSQHCLQNLLIRKFLDSESTALLSDGESFCHTCVPLFSVLSSATTAIKAKNTAHVTPSVIRKILNIQSSGPELVKLLTWLVVLIKTVYISTSPAFCEHVEHCYH